MVLFQTLQCRSGRGKGKVKCGLRTLPSAQPQTLLKPGKGDLGWSVCWITTEGSQIRAGLEDVIGGIWSGR